MRPYFATPELIITGEASLAGNGMPIPELKVTYDCGSLQFEGSIRSSEDVASFMRKTFGEGEVELQEQLVVLYLNHDSKIIGHYCYSKVGIKATVADIRVILGAALKCAAVQLIICHNYPSGNTAPNNADLELTRQLKDAAKLMDIKLLDHLIITKKDFRSFADDGLLGLKVLSSFKEVPAKANAWQRNQDIEALIGRKDAGGESYSDEERVLLRSYSGAGGQGKHGATGQGVLYEFYTPNWVCEWMWKMAMHYGYDGGAFLEPSCATGELLRPAPDKSQAYAFEINDTTRRIAQILYPEAHIHAGYFETSMLQPPRYTTRCKEVTWLEGYPFSLVIGNPPYGKYINRYSSYFPRPRMKQIELFFYYHGLRMLKSSGLLVYLSGSNLLRNGYTYNDEKKAIQELGCKLVDAYRLPPVFAHSDVPTDIVIIRKK
jgi:hypothetical protein